MSSEQQQHETSALRLWLRYGAVWLVLMVLFGVTLGTAYLHLGGNGATLHVGIALLQVAILWLVFMDLVRSSVLLRLCACVGILFLLFMFSLTFGDYFTRPWNGGGTSLSPHPGRVGSGAQGSYPQTRLPLDQRFGPQR